MEHKKNIRCKIENLLLFVLIFISILSIMMQNELNDLDELWNYNFAKNIADGLIPYRDFSIITTPLISIICGLILKITFNELIVMRILAAILCAVIMYVIYKLFFLLDIKKEEAIILTFFIGYLFNDIFCIDYNYGTLLLTLIIIYIEISLYKIDNNFIKNRPKMDLILGILAGLSIVTKQTSGICICIVLLSNKFLFVRKKEEFLICLKSFIFRLIGIMSIFLAFLSYLFYNNAFEEFISYTILGVTEFTNTLPYLKLIKFDLIGILAILVPITIVYTWIKCVAFEKCKSEYILLIYGVAIFVICFPITDKIHFLIGGLPIIIILLCEVSKLILLIKNKISHNGKVTNIFLKILKYGIILFLICYSIINFYNYFKMSEDYCKLNHFKYICIPADWQTIHTNVYNCIIENKDVKILDAIGVFFMIPTDRYNKDYDMFNKGNFGYEGEKRLMEEISNSNDTKYLILKQKLNGNWQTPFNIINFVRKNKEKTGEIEIFEIYE